MKYHRQVYKRTEASSMGQAANGPHGWAGMPSANQN